MGDARSSRAAISPQSTTHELAERQHGVVARRQLTLSPAAVKHALATGRLHEVHRGVYAVGHRRLTQRGRWMAAVLAAGPGAVLSHRAAAALWGLRSGTAVEISAPTRVRRPGITAHGATIPPDERVILDGIPVTTVARTLLDLAAVVAKHELEAALHQAEYQQRTDLVSLDALVARYPHRRGIASLRA